MAAPLAALVLGAGVVLPVPAAAAPCVTSGPAANGASVTICLSEPAPGALLVGDVRVSATVTTDPPTPVASVGFTLGGAYVLTDLKAPFTFILPSQRFPVGVTTLDAVATLRTAPAFTSDPVGIDVGVGSASTGSGRFTPVDPDVPADGTVVVAAAGDGADGRTASRRVGDLILNWSPDLFLYLGDIYERGSWAEFRNWYGTKTYFGRLRSITNPTIGNHEYEDDPAAQPYFAYWGSPPHAYAVDTGNWRLISIDSTIAFDQVSPGTDQYAWLEDRLAGAGDCTLVYFHHSPLDLQDHEDTQRLADLWSLLASSGVDVVLSGHHHSYVRWQPLGPDRSVTADGATLFTVGTGGHSLYDFTRQDARVAFAQNQTYGALRLALRPGSFAFRYIGIDGVTLDEGTRPCTPAYVRRGR